MSSSYSLDRIHGNTLQVSSPVHLTAKVDTALREPKAVPPKQEQSPEGKPASQVIDRVEHKKRVQELELLAARFVRSILFDWDAMANYIVVMDKKTGQEIYRFPQERLKAVENKLVMHESPFVDRHA